MFNTDHGTEYWMNFESLCGAASSGDPADPGASTTSSAVIVSPSGESIPDRRARQPVPSSHRSGRAGARSRNGLRRRAGSQRRCHGLWVGRPLAGVCERRRPIGSGANWTGMPLVKVHAMSNMAGIRTDRRANFVGALWMVGAMAAFAVEDALVKGVTATLPVAQVLVLFGLGGAIVFAATAFLREERLFGADVLSRPMRVRVCFEVVGRLFYTLALALTPLSATTAILQATPIVVVAGAALIFGETVGWRRWTAIVVGLIGVLIILRPTPSSFSPLSILAVIGMIGFAGRDLASRAAPRSLSTAALGFYGFIALMLAGALFAGWEQRAFVLPDGRVWLMLAATAALGACAYASLMKAMRTGAVSSVTPFRYSRLLFGVALGLIVFDESIDVAMAVGCCVVIGSGLFILWRSGRQAR